MAPLAHVDAPQPAEPALPAAQETALRGLVSGGVLTESQADAVRAVLGTSGQGRGPHRWLAEAAGYVGGALMFGGAGVLLATSWDRLTDATRSALLGGVSVLLAAAGLAIAGGPSALVRLRQGASPTRCRLVGVLFALAAGTAAGAAGVLGGEHAGVAASGAGLAAAAAGYAVLPSVFGLLASAVFSAVLAVATVDDLVGATPLRGGVALLLVGAFWAALAAFGVAAPRGVGLGLGAAIALFGAQQPLGQTGAAGWAYGLTLAVALGCFLLYPSQRVAVLLAGGVLAVAIAVPEAVWDLTGGTVGGAVVLLLAGGTLVAGSGIGLRLWRGRKR